MHKNIGIRDEMIPKGEQNVLVVVSVRKCHSLRIRTHCIGVDTVDLRDDEKGKNIHELCGIDRGGEITLDRVERSR